MYEIFSPLVVALATAVGGTLAAWLLARVRPGRFARTVEQANKLIDFVERFAATYNGLDKIGDKRRDDLERLMLDAAQAVREDFEDERTVLPEFEKSTSTLRRALLLYFPARPIIWPAYLVFHTLLIFMVYIVAVRALFPPDGGWKSADTAAFLIAGVSAALIRIVIHLTAARPQ